MLKTLLVLVVVHVVVPLTEPQSRPGSMPYRLAKGTWVVRFGIITPGMTMEEVNGVLNSTRLRTYNGGFQFYEYYRSYCLNISYDDNDRVKDVSAHSGPELDWWSVPNADEFIAP